MIAAYPLNKLIGACTNGILYIFVVADFVKVCLAGYATQAGSDTIKECLKRSGKVNCYRVIVNDIATLKVGEKSSTDRAFKAVIKGELNILRRHLGAVMELNALAKMESVCLTVFREVIALCQCRSERSVRFKTE